MKKTFTESQIVTAVKRTEAGKEDQTVTLMDLFVNLYPKKHTLLT